MSPQINNTNAPLVNEAGSRPFHPVDELTYLEGVIAYHDHMRGRSNAANERKRTQWLIGLRYRAIQMRHWIANH